MTLQLLKMHRGTATGRFIQYLCCRLIGLMGKRVTLSAADMGRNKNRNILRVIQL